MYKSKSMKDLTQILKTRKPRTPMQVLKMVFYICKNFCLSSNFVVVFVFLYLAYLLVVKKKLPEKVFWGLIDRLK